jgi:7-carboxy-7-deazaguanine synthase (Cx14CxxC type)
VGTDGPGGGKFASADELAAAVAKEWPVDSASAYVVCTGGEPLLQLDHALIEALHAKGFEVGVETNGTISAPLGIDWLCVSPKGNARLVQERGNELKLVFPQQEAEAQPACFSGLEFDHFFLQPCDDAQRDANTAAAIQYCMAHPRWRLSLQTHKLTGIP